MPKRLRKGKRKGQSDKAERRLRRAVAEKQRAAVEELIGHLTKGNIKAFDLDANGFPDGMAYLTWIVASNCDLPYLNIKQALQAFKTKHGILPSHVGLSPKHREVRMWHPKLVIEIDSANPSVVAESPVAQAILKRVKERKAKARR